MDQDNTGKDYVFGVVPDNPVAEDNYELEHDHFDLICCDFSFRRPGFAAVRYHRIGHRASI